MSLSRKIKNNKRWIDFISFDKENQNSNISIKKSEIPEKQNYVSYLKNQSEQKKFVYEIKSEKKNPISERNKLKFSYDEQNEEPNLTLTERNDFSSFKNPYICSWNKLKKGEIVDEFQRSITEPKQHKKSNLDCLKNETDFIYVKIMKFTLNFFF